MLYKRVISALLFLPFFYLFTWVLPPVYLTVLVVAAGMIGQYEFYRMAKARGTTPNMLLGIAAGVILIVEAYTPLFPGAYSYYLTAFVLLLLSSRLFSAAPVDGAIEDVAVTMTGVFYVAFLFSYLVAVRMLPNGKQWLVFLFFIIWASDIGAYSVGIPFGRHRLYEKISPKKSMEGLAGSAVAAAGMALLCRIWFIPSVGIVEAAGVAVLLALVGTVGDLAESMFKRAAGIKDSGGIIPGHGGMLDRMDSMMFAAPVLYYYVQIRS
jgi:phosphatidate cytidylyltransferase